jgi:hypothetical protein
MNEALFDLDTSGLTLTCNSLVSTSGGDLARHLKFAQDAYTRQELMHGNLTPLALTTILTPILYCGNGSTGFAANWGVARNCAPFLSIYLDLDKLEISNLPRQANSVTDLGKNKAEAAARSTLGLLPHAQILYGTQGVDPTINLIMDELDRYCQKVNEIFTGKLFQPVEPVVFDSIDVTTQSGWEARFRLHYELAIREWRGFGAFDLEHSSLVFNFPYDTSLKVPFGGRIVSQNTPQDNNMALLPNFLGIPDVPLGYARQYIDRAKRIVALGSEGLLNRYNIPAIPQERTAGALFEAVAPLLLNKKILGVPIPERQYIHAEQPERFDRLRVALLFLTNLAIIKQSSTMEHDIRGE